MQGNGQRATYSGMLRLQNEVSCRVRQQLSILQQVVSEVVQRIAKQLQLSICL